MDWNTVQQMFRMLLLFASGFQVNSGYLTEEMSATLIGGLLSVGSVIWWMFWNKNNVK